MSTSFVFTPQDFGAKADGVSLDTISIQSAIDRASEARGTVFFAPGRYLTGSLYLRSHVTVQLSRGAELIGSIEKEYYPQLPEPSDPELQRTEYYRFALLHGEGLEDVCLTGGGTINGRGGELYQNLLPHYPIMPGWGYIHTQYRPVLLQLVNCRGCEVSNLKLQSPAAWMQSYLHCEDVRIENLTIDSLVMWNNDGIDLCGSRNVIIRGCRINCADDGICLKSSSRPVENIVISDCIIRCSASALKFGTASAQGFRNITVNNLTVYDTARSGIALQAVDGGVIEQVSISNVTMRNVGNAIFLRIGDRSRQNRAGASHLGVLRDVTLSNITAEVIGFDSDAGYPFRAPRISPLPNPLPGIIIAGLPDAKIEDVFLNNMVITHRGDLTSPATVLAADQCHTVPEGAAEYPEYDQFGELPAWGAFIRHARGIVLRDVRMKREGIETRPMLASEDATDLVIG